jgi:transposase
VIVPKARTRSRTGEAISPGRRTPAQRRKLDAFIADTRQRNDLEEWRRGVAIRGYLEGRAVVGIAKELEVTRGSVNRWLGWYDAEGVDGLRTGVPPGRAPFLSVVQRAELTALIEAGPVAAGYRSGVWTGPEIGDLIERRYGVRYHNHHVPRLLHQLGFSVQRPRKRLARADLERQAYWLRTTLPAIKKKPPPAAGL